MNFSTVRGYNAYTQFSAKIKETVKPQETLQDQDFQRDGARSLYSDPVDTVSISRTARSLSLSLIAEREPAQTKLKEWMRESGTISGTVTHSISGKNLSEMMAANGISLELEDRDTYNLNLDVWCAATVTGKNAEKAKAIQDLLNSTPRGINWGFLLQKLPPGN